ncbi:MAG: hypothetical protein M9947_19265, partial [Thermomicrobiales bacterium]|nr:hypothetical protein [Thermomicrobiales bacterium]
DMKTLLAHADDPQTAIALELYVYLARKQLGGLLAILGGIDLLVFTGGVGEHAPEIRERIGRGFDFAGIRIDPEKNATDSTEISYDGVPVRVMVLPSDEERMIARDTVELIHRERTL